MPTCVCSETGICQCVTEEIQPTYKIYSKPGCSYCDKAKALLDMKKLPYIVLTLNVDYSIQDLQLLVPNVRTVPQIFKDNRLIGGFDDLKASLD
jgi:glutaredoxin